MPNENKKMPEKKDFKRDTRRKGNMKRGARNNDRKQFGTEFDKDAWQPKTEIGKKVKSGEIKDIDEILDKGYRILEAEIVDVLFPEITVELLLVGQSKGKFGGGARRVFRQTQKKTKEGNKPKFSTIAVVGNGNGYVGIGHGKSKETVPAREKSIRNAKKNIIKIRRGAGSWEDSAEGHHSIPFAIQGKCGSIKIKLMPAPKGTGLKVEKECAKILKIAGINDVWSKTIGHTSTKLNLIYACIDALKKLMYVKTKEGDAEKVGMIEGAVNKKEANKENKEEITTVVNEEPEKVEVVKEPVKDGKSHQSSSKAETKQKTKKKKTKTKKE